MADPAIIVAVLAHNEERRIARCLGSLPLGDADVDVHVVVNGSSDRTAEIARGFGGVTVHEYYQGGKARSWNRFVLETPDLCARTFVFVDGDAELVPGSIRALDQALALSHSANAASGLPANGRRVEAYRRGLVSSHGMFGDLYALRGSFVERMRARGIRLPEDLIGDDGLLCAMAKTDLGSEYAWQETRVAPCLEAGFLCEPASVLLPRTLALQYRRMINYSVRHFQNRIVSAIMRDAGPAGLPPRLASLYPQWLGRFKPRADPRYWWFDRQALARMTRDALA